MSAVKAKAKIIEISTTEGTTVLQREREKQTGDLLEISSTDYNEVSVAAFTLVSKVVKVRPDLERSDMESDLL